METIPYDIPAKPEQSSDPRREDIKKASPLEALERVEDNLFRELQQVKALRELLKRHKEFETLLPIARRYL